MSAKIEFGQKGPKRDLYAELLLASQEARIRFDLLTALNRKPYVTAEQGYLRGLLEHDLRKFREEIDSLMTQLGG